jgi:hypothetical protein
MPEAMKQDFGALKDSHTVDMSTAKAALDSISGISIDCCEAILPLLRFEIFRDFAQITGVIIVFSSEVSH